VATNGIGTSGVAPHTSLVAVKVCDALGNCSFAAIIAGILHATNVGVDVINLSLGGTFPKSAPGGGTLVAALNRAVNYANRHGVLVVSGSGNDAVDLQHNGNLIATPCESGAGLCVSASGPDDLLASYSNYGTSAIHVAAPGGDSVAAGNPLDSMVLGPCTTRSILPALAACAANLQYLLVEGTSQAAPHVSGAAALLDAQSNGALSAARLKTALQRTADDLGEPGTDAHYGKGRLNVCRLLGC
jgi:lantibiotic leader peptide-processing serine protease